MLRRGRFFEKLVRGSGLGVRGKGKVRILNVWSWMYSLIRFSDLIL